jgi:hypothetical protein
MFSGKFAGVKMRRMFLSTKIKRFFFPLSLAPSCGFTYFAKFKRYSTMIKYFILLLPLVFFSCRDQNMTFDIGSKYVDVRTTLRYVDTLTVNSYTVKVDSMRTSGLTSPSVVVGMYHDPELGDIAATSYFRIGLPGTITLPKGAVFDSLGLMMIDDDYWQGDTLQPFTLNVHRLNQIIKVHDDGYLYNTSSFRYDEEAIGTVTMNPKPHVNDTLWVPMDSTLGQELFNLIREKDDKMQQQDNFLTYFKGLALTWDPSDKAVLGFNIGSSLPSMRLYYHYTDFSTITKHLDFGINSYTSLQFNQFEIRNPLIALPESQKNSLPAATTDHKTFVLGGAGLATRVEFPFLKDLRAFYDNMNVLKAELIVEPARNSYKFLPLPEKLSLFQTDHLNRFGEAIYSLHTSTILEGDLVIDEVFQEETSYTFDITDFVSYKLTEASDEVPALLITITPDGFYKSMDRVVLGSLKNADNRVKLKLYYMNYE